MKLLPLAGALTLASALAVPFALDAGASAPAPLAPAASPAAMNLEVDGGHSSVVFRIQHMRTAYFYGRFNEVSGDIVYDASDPSQSSVTITIPAASVDTNSEKRDQHVKSPDFLDAKQFPELKFTSKRVAKDGDLWKVSGDLELHGVTKEISFDMEKTGEGDARGGGKLVGFHARFTIDRKDFGMDYMVGPLGQEIEVTVSLETKGS